MELLQDLNFRKIKNFLRKHSSNICDETSTRKLLYKLYFYDINGYPIAKLKSDNDIDLTLFPQLFQIVNKDDIINIYNNYVKSNYFTKININDLFYNYDINKDFYLKISLKTFRPIYNKNWKKISEEINNIEFNKQFSFYADYLRCYLKLRDFPTFNEFLKFLFNKYKKPIHKDIKVIFENIEKSYSNVKKYIKINNLHFDDIKKILIKSTNISNRINMENSN